MNERAYNLGDIVTMKKPHACKTNEMEIIRMGMDIRIKCRGCAHSILIPRHEFEKKMKKIIVRNSENELDS